MIAGIRDQALAISRLINNLLDMARLHSGKVALQLEWEPVEDDRNIREVVASALESEGYQVHEAATAVDAARLVGARAVALAIVDLGLPDRDGVDFIRDLRVWSPIPVLVLSARHQERDKVTALDSGADDYLAKPFGVAELLARRSSDAVAFAASMSGFRQPLV